MKRIHFYLLSLCVLITISSAPAWALGIGAYYEFGGVDTGLLSGGHTPSGMVYTHTGGFVLDTAVAKDKIFNFRFCFGGGYANFYELKRDGLYWDSENDDYEEYGDAYWIPHYYSMINFDTVYGIAFFRMQYIRLWIGPELGLGILKAEDSDADGTGMRFQIGALLGMNINLGSVFTFSLEGGYRFNVGIIPIGQTDEHPLFSASDSFMGHEGVLRMSMLFRINDDYNKTPQPAPAEPASAPSNPAAIQSSTGTWLVTLVSKACMKGQIEKVKQCIQDGLNINGYDKWGWSPIMWACYYEYDYIVRLLLEHGANPDIKSASEYGVHAPGSTPLMMACYSNKPYIVKLLLEFKADKTVQNSYGQTAESFALKIGSEEIYNLVKK